MQLCATRFRELYPFWIILPSSILLWGSVCFFCAILWRRVSVVLWSYRPAKMTDVKKQRICIKFCFKLGKTASETHRMLKEAFGDNAVAQTQTYEWFKRFKNGRTTFDRNHDRKCGKNATGSPGRPMTNDSRCLQHYNAMFWGDWGKISGANVQTNGATPGSCNSHDSAPAHASLVVRQFLASANTTVIPTLPAHRTSPPVIFSYFWRWNWSSRGDVLTQLTFWRRNCLFNFSTFCI